MSIKPPKNQINNLIFRGFLFYFILLFFLKIIDATINVVIINNATVPTELSPVAGTTSFADELELCVSVPFVVVLVV